MKKSCKICTDSLKIEKILEISTLVNWNLFSNINIAPRAATKFCIKHQKKYAIAIKNNRYCGILPFTTYGFVV